MLFRIKNKVTRWEVGNESDYQHCYDLYGGNVSTHPNILKFLHQRTNCNPRYYIKRGKNGGLLGSFCIWGKQFLASDHEAFKKFDLSKYPIAHDELILPFAPTMRATLPFKSKSLSSLNQRNFRNVSFRLNSGREICLAKDGFSSKTKSRRNKELREFIAAGGEVRDQASYSAEELTHIYLELFKIRWGVEPNNVRELFDFIQNLRHHIFGHVLVMNGKPCAFQLITTAESPDWIAFDYINGGVDTDLNKFSPGTIVTWLNVKAAFELCQSKNKTMRYSFGKPTADYKDRWCYRAPVGRALVL